MTALTPASSAEMSINLLLTARLAQAIAVLTVFAVVALGLLYAGLPFFGPVNDITNAVIGLLNAVLFLQFHALLRARSPGLALLLLGLGWAGSAAIIVNSVLVAFGRMHWMTGGMYTALGLGLHGIWLLAFLYLALPQPFLTSGLVRLGIAVGVGNLFGLVAGPLLASGAKLEGNPWVWIAYLGAAAGYLLYPVWCWLLGRQILGS